MVKAKTQAGDKRAIALARATDKRSTVNTAKSSLLPSGKPATGLKVPKNTSWSDDSRAGIVSNMDVGATVVFTHEADLSKMSNKTITRNTLHDTIRPMRQTFNSTIQRVLSRVSERTGATFTTTSQVQFWDSPARLVFVIMVTRLPDDDTI